MLPLSTKQSEKILSTAIIIFGLILNGIPLGYKSVVSTEDVTLNGCTKVECISYSDLVPQNVKVSVSILNADTLRGNYSQALGLYGVVSVQNEYSNQPSIIRDPSNEVKGSIESILVENQLSNPFEQGLLSIFHRYNDYFSGSADTHQEQQLVEHRIITQSYNSSDTFHIRISITYNQANYIHIHVLLAIFIIFVMGISPVLYGKYRRSRHIEKLITKNEEESVINPEEFSRRMREEILKKKQSNTNSE